MNTELEQYLNKELEPYLDSDLQQNSFLVYHIEENDFKWGYSTASYFIIWNPLLELFQLFGRKINFSSSEWKINTPPFIFNFKIPIDVWRFIKFTLIKDKNVSTKNKLYNTTLYNYNNLIFDEDNSYTFEDFENLLDDNYSLSKTELPFLSKHQFLEHLLLLKYQQV
jgi:hypothetical protein